MKIPGFTAEVSLGRMSEYYTMTERVEQIDGEVQLAQVYNPKIVVDQSRALDLFRCIEWVCTKWRIDKDGWPVCQEEGFVNVCL